MNLKDIPVSNEINYNDSLNEVDEGEYVYQFQPTEKEKFGTLVTVGKTLNHSDVMVNKFDYKKNIKCHLLSCLYNKFELSSIQSVCIFPILKLNVFTEKKKYKSNKCAIKLNLESNLQYNFHTFEHIQKKTDIINFSSDDKNKLNDLKGFYSITFHKDNKMTYLEKYKEALTNSDMIKMLIEKFILTQSEKII